MIPVRRLLAAVTIVIAGMMVTACRERRVAGTEFRGAPVILISVDTLRADHLTAYGAKLVDTPAIDRLANDGIVFENAYAHVPLTLPSHVTILTGRLPYENGVRDNTGFRLERGIDATIPKLLAGQGYTTGAAVSAYVLRRDTGLASLFDFYDDAIEVRAGTPFGALQRPGDATVHAALSWLDRVETRPFFLFLHLFEPHTPYEPVEPFRSRYASPYDGEIATADAIVGRFLAELDRRKLYDRSLIIFESDHGEGLRDHGEAEHGILLYRETLHVPLIVKLPGRTLAGTRVAEAAELVDILPTVVKATGAPLPQALPGMSLIDLAHGAHRTERAVYSETLYPRLHFGWSQLRSLIDRQQHYIEGPAPELYDVARDPEEKRNVREAQRRDAQAFAAHLGAIPLNLQAQSNISADEMRRLGGLGYLSGGAPANGPLRNPRDRIGVVDQIQKAFDLYSAARYAESAALCRAILRENPGLVDIELNLAKNLRGMGRLGEALQTYRDAVQRSPQIAGAVAIEIAGIEMEMRDLVAAERDARAAMATSPEDAHRMLAGIAEARSDAPAAEREARLAIGNAPQPPILALLLLARAVAAQGRLAEALTIIDPACERVASGAEPPVSGLDVTRGDILVRMSRFQEAEAAFRQEVHAFPAATDAYVRLAVLFAIEHRDDEIAPEIDAMVRASPHPQTYEVAAQTMEKLGNKAGARDYRERGRKLR